jgi:hypothetical protein
MLVVREGMDRQQLDRGDAEALDVIDDRLLTEALELAAQLRRDRRVQLGHAAHMGLVEHGLAPGDLRPRILAPILRLRIDDPAFRHAGGAVAFAEGEILLFRVQFVAVMRRRPFDVADQLAGIGVEQQFVGIEAVALLRRVGPVHTVAIERAGTDSRQIAVPDLVGIFGKRDPVDLAPALGVEQAKLDPLGMGGEDREIGARAVPPRAQRARIARQNFTGGRHPVCHSRDPRLLGWG